MKRKQKVEIVVETDRSGPLSWLRRFAEKCLEAEKLERKGCLLIVLVDNTKIKEINRQFFNRDRSTDVIAFSYDENEESWGEIVISVDQAEQQARDYDVSFKNELARLTVHGILHLAGYKDNTADLKSEMHQKEDEYLTKFHELTD